MYLKNLLYVVLLAIVFVSCKEKSTEKEMVVEAKDSVVVDKTERPKNQVLTKEQLIATALMAAPEEQRAAAKVYGYGEDGQLITLREGSNEMICIADNPEKEGFKVVCYHKDLEPFMARGRELSAEDKSNKERREIRELETVQGKLKMPENPTTLHVLEGKDAWYNTATDQLENAKYRYVVYVPFATQATTGLPLKPNNPGHPWLMFPGKADAHIMISPPAEE